MRNRSAGSFSFSPDLIRYRCLSSRLLSRMTAKRAAQKMGYKNTSMISKMEKKTSKTAINFNFIARASLCYGVSVDYLLGLSDYPERDPKSVEQLAIYHSIRHYADGLADQLIGGILEGASSFSLEGQLTMMCSEVTNLIDAVDKVRELNPKFDSKMRAGAMLIRNAESMRVRVNRTKDRLSKKCRDQNILRQFKSVLMDGRENQLDMVGFDGDDGSKKAD